MSDPSLATKAPESDAQEVKPSPISSTDTPAQSGPSLGEHCTTPAPLNTEHKPKGEVTYLGEIATYITKPSSYPSEPSRLLLLLTGGTGLHSLNNQHQADLFAARGFVVIMPDQFDDDPAPNTSAMSPNAAAAPGSEEPSLLEKVKLGVAETAKSFQIDMWLARQTPEKVLPVLGKVLEAARETFADAVANGGGVYGVGYCVGAKYLLSLLSTPPFAPKTGQADVEKVETEPELKVGAIAHGAMINKDDLEAVRRPLAVVAVAGDQLFPDEVREQGKAALELNGVEHDVRVFDGVPHGFALVGDYGEQDIRGKQEEAFEMMCGWLEAR